MLKMTYCNWLCGAFYIDLFVWAAVQNNSYGLNLEQGHQFVHNFVIKFCVEQDKTLKEINQSINQFYYVLWAPKYHRAIEMGPWIWFEIN